MAHPGAGSDYLTGLAISKGESWKAQKGNFGPQIGFAWMPEKFNGKLVTRGGYGLSYNQEEIAISANIGNNPGLVVFPTLSISTPTSPILALFTLRRRESTTFTATRPTRTQFRPSAPMDFRQAAWGLEWDLPGQSPHYADPPLLAGCPI